MKTSDTHELGMNRTGIKTSPLDSKSLSADAESLTFPPEGDALNLGQNRIVYMKEAEIVGHVPIPTKFLGNPLLLDKLGERLAFERTGTRLYDALISKHQGAPDFEFLPPLESLLRYREEERSHFLLVASVIDELGGDSTAMTPAADIGGIAAIGLIQILTDPRTSFVQCLDAILIAELADNDGWDLLISITEDAGLNQAAERFREASAVEAIHLASVREWLMNLSIGEKATATEPGIRTRAGTDRTQEGGLGEDRLQSQ